MFANMGVWPANASDLHREIRLHAAIILELYHIWLWIQDEVNLAKLQWKIEFKSYKKDDIRSEIF